MIDCHVVEENTYDLYALKQRYQSLSQVNDQTWCLRGSWLCISIEYKNEREKNNSAICNGNGDGNEWHFFFCIH